MKQLQSVFTFLLFGEERLTLLFLDNNRSIESRYAYYDPFISIFVYIPCAFSLILLSSCGQIFWYELHE